MVNRRLQIQPRTGNGREGMLQSGRAVGQGLTLSV